MGTGVATDPVSTHTHSPIKGLHFKKGNRTFHPDLQQGAWRPNSSFFLCWINVGFYFRKTNLIATFSWAADHGCLITLQDRNNCDYKINTRLILQLCKFH